MGAQTAVVGIGDSWTRYLAEVGRVALLEHDEVRELAHRIEVGVLAQDRLTQLGEDTDGCCDPGLIADLRTLIAQGGAAHHRLVAANLRLVVAVARRARRHSMPLADLVQEGALGLMRAVEKYDYQRGFAFSTYAVWWIRQAVTRALAEQSRAVRVPVHVHDQVVACARARDEIAAWSGREATTTEVARRSGIDATRVGVLLRSSTPALSLHTEVPGGTIDGVLVADLPDPVDALAAADARELLDAALQQLPDRHRQVMTALVGWHDGRPRSRRTVAEETGLSRGVVQRLEAEAREMLRTMPTLAGLDDPGDG
jgi:RNA polymerase sigma factor (sigma-70 family)